MAEKRNYVRFGAEGEVELKLEGEKKDIIQASLVDIGFLGFCSFTDKKLAPGSPLEFKIYIKLIREDFTGHGKVISCTEIKKYRRTIFRTAIVYLDMNKEKILSILTKVQDYINKEKRKRWQSGDAGVGLL